METRQLPAPERQEHEQQPPVITLAYIVIAITWVLVFVIGIGINKGPWASWWTIVLLGLLIALGASIHFGHEKYKKHQLHQEDVADRKHHRAMTQLAIVNDHSAEHITATSSFRAISKYMGPASSLTIKDNNMGQAQIGSADVAQPLLSTVIEELTENALEIPFGINRETGQLVKSSLQKAVHLNSIGDSGGGKSSGATGILTALTTKNDKEHLRYAFIDAENETTVPFQQMPQVGYLADDPRDAAKVLAELVRVKRQRDITKALFPFILLFCEEFLTLKRRMPQTLQGQALEDFTELACSGRKRNIALYTIGQTSYSDKRIRDAQAQFQTIMAYPIHPQRARAAGFIETPLLNQVYKEKRSGQFVLEHKGDNAIILAPFVDAQTVSNLLLPSVRPVSAESPPDTSSLSNGRTDGRHSEVDFDTSQLVLKMTLDEKGITEIAKTAFPNMRETDAVKEVRRYLAYLVRKEV
jgi:hypothetical protein